MALLTGLYVTLTLKDGSYVSSIRRIKVRDLRLDRIHEINEISRSLSAHTMDIEEAFHALKAIESDHSDLHFRFYYFALAAGGFALMMGATVLESIIGGLAACTVILSRKMVRGRISGSFIPSFLHAFIITFTLGLVVRFFPILHLDRMVIGSLISLFPGTTLTTGIRDTMKADYLTGAGNLISALVSAMALVVGTYFAMVLTGGRFL